MYFNYGYKRRQFELEQEKLRKQYEAAGMTEEAIQAMYEDALAWFRSCRNETLHSVCPREMMTVDPSNGDFRYMDMDELPAKAPLITSTDRYAWIDEIENAEMRSVIRNFSLNYKEIITLRMEGFPQCEIARQFGVSEMAISKKISKIEKKLEKFRLGV